MQFKKRKRPKAARAGNSYFQKLPPAVRRYLKIFLVIALVMTLAITQWPLSKSSYSNLNLDSSAQKFEIELPLLDITTGSEASLEDLEEIRAEYSKLKGSFILNDYKLRSDLKKTSSASNFWITRYESVLRSQIDTKKTGGPIDAIELTNPGLLFYPKFLILDPLNPSPWNLNLIQQSEALNSRSFLFYPKVKAVTFNPQFKFIEARFDLTDFIGKASTWMTNPLKLDAMKFELSGFNAFDFGYTWMKISSTSTNIENPEIDQMVGNFSFIENIKDPPCFHPEGCNSIMNFNFPNPFSIVKLPATVVMHLWLNMPEDLNQAPDLEYRLIFS